MRRTTLIILSFVLFFFASYAQNDLNKPLPQDSSVIVGKLDNGLTYYIKRNNKPENRIFLDLVVNAGSVCEDDDQQGLAHFTEHMAFNGTQNFPKHKLIDFLESIGMKFGADLNAYTSFDETVYMLEIPADNPAYLDTALLILHDWSHYLSLETDEINNERGVILEEWRLGKGAQDRLTRKTFPVIFYGSKYAERLPIGKPDIIRNFDPDVLRRFYKDWYRPDLEAVIVVGDVDPKAVEQKIKQIFSSIPEPQNPRPRVYPEVPEHQDIKAVVAQDSEASRSALVFYWKHPAKTIKTYEDYRQDLVDQLTATMLSSRFREQMLKPKNPFAIAMGLSYDLFDKTDAFIVLAIPKKGKAADAARLILQDVESAKRYGFSQSELDRAKKQIMAQTDKFYNEKDKTESKYFVDELHQNFGVRHKPILSIEQEYKIIKQLLPTITVDDANKAIKELAPDKNLVITLTGPTDDQFPTADELVQIAKEVRNSNVQPYKDVAVGNQLITKKIKPGKVKSVSTDEVTGTTQWTLKNGIKVVFKPTNFKNDEILLSAYSPGGYSLYSGDDIINARNAADLIANSGVGDFNNSQLTKFMMGKNVSVSPYINLYYEGFKGSSSVKDFETMLQLIYLYYTQPRFDTTDYRAYVEQLKAMMMNKANDPMSVWNDTVIYYLGGRSPYAKPMDIDMLNKLDFKRAYEIYKQRFSDPGSFTFVFVGNINPDQVKPLIEKYLGSLPKKDNKETYRDVHARPQPGKVIEKTVYKGGDQKSLAYMAFTGKINKDLKDRLVLSGVSEVLTKRLLKSIREDQALTYSISAYPLVREIPESYYNVLIFYSSKPDTVFYIKDEIIKIAGDMTKQITDDEYNSTIQKLLRKHEVNMQQNRYWLNKLVEMYKTGSKPDFVTDYDKTVKSITKQDLINGAKQYLLPNSYMIIALKPEKK